MFICVEMIGYLHDEARNPSSMKNSPHLDHYHQAIQIAKAAGKIQRANFGQSLNQQIKASSIDIVTQIDLQCDELIRTKLKSSFPNDIIMTEETFQEEQPIDLSQTWVIDPLDGTTNYAHAFPYFAVSIAYFENGEPIVGVVYNPISDECFSANKGHGAYLNDQKLSVSTEKPIHQCLLTTGFPYDVVNGDNKLYLERFTRMLEKAQGIRRPGAAALDLAFLAAGRIDGFWEYKLSPWDVAAGCLLIKEAGGTLSSIEGAPLRYDQRRIHILATNTHSLQHQIIETFNAPAAPCKV